MEASKQKKSSLVRNMLVAVAAGFAVGNACLLIKQAFPS